MTATSLGKGHSLPITRLAGINTPTLVMHGGAGIPFMKQTSLTLSKAIPNAEFRTLEGQTHAVDSEAIVPVLMEFFRK